MRWRILLAFLFGMASIPCTMLAVELYKSKYPETSIIGIMASAVLVLVAMAFAQDDGQDCTLKAGKQ